MTRFYLGLLSLLLLSQAIAMEVARLPEEAAAIYRKAQQGRWFPEAEKLQARILPTSDGRSFFAVWTPGDNTPKRWIVSLHGSRGFATDDLALWSRHLAGHDIGLLCLQWWNGQDDGSDAYLRPLQIYREIDLALQRVKAVPGNVLFHGFSRGSANAYAIVAIDASKGRKYFSLAIASSGGVGLDYPPTREITSGRMGEQPLRGTRWLTVAGARDPEPERDGIPGMRRTAEWLTTQGAVVIERIEDVAGGHGALMTNPDNARHALDLFEGASAQRR